MSADQEAPIEVALADHKNIVEKQVEVDAPKDEKPKRNTKG